MIPELLKTQIFNQVIEIARTKSAGNPAMLRAIERAAVELQRSAYWAFDAQSGTLKLMSTTSKKLYVVTPGHCACEARTVCKHRVARQLLARYSEILAAPPVSPACQTTAEDVLPSAVAQPSPLAAGVLVSPSLLMRGEKYNGII